MTIIIIMSEQQEGYRVLGKRVTVCILKDRHVYSKTLFHNFFVSDNIYFNNQFLIL